MFLTGLHSGHAQVRNNSAKIFRNEKSEKNPAGEGQYPLAAGTETVGTMFQRAGYKTCVVGKWGLGGPYNDGDPNKQGFDHFFGYLCQREAHNYYPTHLWRNSDAVAYEGNKDINKLSANTTRQIRSSMTHLDSSTPIRKPRKLNRSFCITRPSFHTSRCKFLSTIQAWRRIKKA